jgi:hypothetical protein
LTIPFYLPPALSRLRQTSIRGLSALEIFYLQAPLNFHLKRPDLIFTGIKMFWVIKLAIATVINLPLLNCFVLPHGFEPRFAEPKSAVLPVRRGQINYENGTGIEPVFMMFCGHQP